LLGSHWLGSHWLGSHWLGLHWLGSHLLSSHWLGSFISFIRFLTMENDPTVINSLQLLSTAAGTLSTSTGNAKKRSSDDKKQQSLKKRLKIASLRLMATDLVEERRNNEGKTPHDAIKNAIRTLNENGVDTNRYALLRLIKRIEEEESSGVSPLAAINEGDINTVSPLRNIASNETLPQTVKPKAKKGRPSGTTNADKVRLAKAKIDCTNAITRLYIEERKKVSEKDDDRTALPKGFLKDLIAAQKEVFNLPPEHNIPTQTIYSRMRSDRSEQSSHRGTPSPMATLEKTVVEIAIQMGRIRQPLTPTEALCLVNSLIHNKPLQERLIIWKESRNLDQSDENKGRLGLGYWAGFMKRNGDLLVTKRGEMYATDRAEWSKEVYIKQMYDVIYDEMADAGIAERLVDVVHMVSTCNL
jgi:hypothetical protein